MVAKVPRRTILTAAVATGIACLPRAGVAQAKQRTYRVGILALLEFDTPVVDEFVAELSRRGYAERINFTFERRVESFVAMSELDRAAEELVKAKVDLIFTNGGLPAQAAKKATSTIPIVFFSSPDAIGMGLVQSLAQPGANLTGSSVQAWETNTRELQLFSQACGRLTTVANLIPNVPGSGPLLDPQYAAPLVDAANALGIRIRFIGYELGQDLRPVVEQLAREGIDAVGLSDAPSSDAFRSLAALLIRLRLPSLGNPSDGFLLRYEASPAGVGRIAARQVDQIFGGAKPANIPIEQLSTFELEINMRTAGAIGLSIPQSVLLQATRLIR